ncbi:glyoxalase/bleomycin resistance/dioxygenase family protein [Nitrogeniibacter mangrovi]|uniref:Glyoxalase/bleomycin resistance/dioxygenase family protein n=1 Tax=Nitrogeniibacter mangrovi TaxID=2016596 RepID=A0A6C1AZV1_9RHOO|nr:ArsI/CadI family heavy metal resistance metalloenzyme [Nitrogeniibacter mangrovi]QID16653.1 glyoxalase/bleomycin resistance/dioxygenase family protein [Nitrogeniibacter mangrovi]
MKRFHVHLAVDDLDANIAFYTQLFGLPPSKQEADYAKWMLDDPRVNFAISARGHAPGVNHFGMQAETAEGLAELKAQAGAASAGAVLDQGETVCCYAKSEKHWVTDPQGLAWEHFTTLGTSVTFGDDSVSAAGACCVPEAPAAAAGCCAPAPAESAPKSGCCG